MGEESHLIACLVGLDTIAERECLLVPVLNFDVAVAHTSLVQTDLPRQQETVYLDSHADLVAIVARAIKCVKVFLFRLHHGVVGLLLVVTDLLEELFLFSESLLALYLHVAW